MADFSYELTSKLKKAESREEVEALLKADGQDLALTDEVWAKAEELRAQDGQELSLDELEDVAGGRDWYEDGCAATVEIGSDCWSTDGGCAMCNISYSSMPNCKCPKCGAKAFYHEPDSCISPFYVACRNCGMLWGVKP